MCSYSITYVESFSHDVDLFRVARSRLERAHFGWLAFFRFPATFLHFPVVRWFTFGRLARVDFKMTEHVSHQVGIKRV